MKQAKKRRHIGSKEADKKTNRQAAKSYERALYSFLLLSLCFFFYTSTTRPLWSSSSSLFLVSPSPSSSSWAHSLFSSSSFSSPSHAAELDSRPPARLGMLSGRSTNGRRVRPPNDRRSPGTPATPIHHPTPPPRRYEGASPTPRLAEVQIRARWRQGTSDGYLDAVSGMIIKKNKEFVWLLSFFFLSASFSLYSPPQ